VSPVEMAELAVVLRHLDGGPRTIATVRVMTRPGKKGLVESRLVGAEADGYVTIAYYQRGEPYYCLTPAGVALLDRLDVGKQTKESKAS
jgi:hypothetical protein